ncbi:HPr family phosphocarrier protein, partial [Bacillus altitudinis]|uniref:HPr family phosphocarrier protein n=2 Tax=Bacillati TaxID=1783272 RepID=UPI001FAD0660
GKTGAKVTLTTSAGKSVNAASILGVLSLGINHGDEVVIATDGDNAEAALDELAALLETDLDKD